MARWQRAKGASYEREVAQTFSRALGIPVNRKLGQARDSGNDIDVLPLVVECKRRKSLTTLESWMEQAEASVGVAPIGDNYYPLVVARADGCESLAVMRLDDFLHFVSPELRRRIRQRAIATSDRTLLAALSRDEE